MRVLRDTISINEEIKSCSDRSIAQLLADHLAFIEVNEEGLLIAIMVERGDTLQVLDEQFESKFLINHYSGRRHGDPGFVPCFETLGEHPTFFEMFFIEGGGELGISLLVPKQPGIDIALLEMCARHATPATELSS